MGKKTFDTLNAKLIKSLSSKNDQKNVSKKKEEDSFPPNKGKMQADATVADQYISFPTDAKLLNNCRKKLDEMIEEIYLFYDKKITKPRTYKKSLNTAFLNYSKNKNKSRKVHRKIKRKLLESVLRNYNFVLNLKPDPDHLVLGKS